MTWRVAPFDRAAEEVLAHVRATYEPLGIVIAGSIVRGEGGPTSDLDVCVIHKAPWRLREQRRFAGVAVEVFVNPPAQIRRYFAAEHAEGRPSTAHMFATGEVIEAAQPVVVELIREAREWMARTLVVTDAALTQRRYGAVDVLDDARDMIDREPAVAAILLARVVSEVVA